MDNKFPKLALFLLRISLGWMMFYAGITKLINPEWTAMGYLNNAKTFADLFQWFALPGNIDWINFVNEWGLVLLGVSLILGVFVRISSFFGALLMLLYYFPVLEFPYIGGHSFIVDEHIIYFLTLLVFAETRVGRIWGLENWCVKLPICSKYPKLRNWLG